MKKFKSAIAITLALFTISCQITNVLASENDNYTTTATDKENPDRSEVTEYKYRYIDGVLYKRLWSVTYNHWIDPGWTPA